MATLLQHAWSDKMHTFTHLSLSKLKLQISLHGNFYRNGKLQYIIVAIKSYIYCDFVEMSLLMDHLVFSGRGIVLLACGVVVSVWLVFYQCRNFTILLLLICSCFYTRFFVDSNWYCTASDVQMMAPLLLRIKSEDLHWECINCKLRLSFTDYLQTYFSSYLSSS